MNPQCTTDTFMTGLMAVFLSFLLNACASTQSLTENQADSAAQPENIVEQETSGNTVNAAHISDDKSDEDSFVNEEVNNERSDNPPAHTEGAYEDTSDEEECVGQNSDSEEWIDVAHNYLSVQFCEPAAWFDSFFESERADEEVRPGSRVRWRNDFVYTEGGDFNYQTDISAKLKLPKASDRLRLTFESDTEEDLPGVLPENREEARGELGVLYELFQSPRANFSIRVRLRPKIRFRYRYTYPVTDTFVSRFTQDFENTKGVNSATTRIDFEQVLSKELVLRWANTRTVTEDVSGREWATGLVLYQYLTKSSALSYESGITGVTAPVATETNYRLGLRYRTSFYRRWLFYELIPEVTWPLDQVTGKRGEIAAFIFRLEINFENLR